MKPRPHTSSLIRVRRDPTIDRLRKKDRFVVMVPPKQPETPAPKEPRIKGKYEDGELRVVLSVGICPACAGKGWVHR